MPSTPRQKPRSRRPASLGSSRIAYGGLLILTVLFVTFMAVFSFQKALTTIGPYDASYNATVSRTLAFQGRYGVWDNGRFVGFPVEVSTGPALLVPLAAAYRWGGDSPYVPNVATVIFCFGVFLLAWSIALRCGDGSSTWFVFSLLVAVCVFFILVAKEGGHTVDAGEYEDRSGFPAVAYAHGGYIGRPVFSLGDLEHEFAARRRSPLVWGRWVACWRPPQSIPSSSRCCPWRASSPYSSFPCSAGGFPVQLSLVGSSVWRPRR